MGNQYQEISTKYLLSRIHPALQKVQGLMPTSGEDRDRLKTSIQTEGIRDPLKVIYGEDGNPSLISGWTRLEIASELGFETVPILHVSPKDPEAYAVSENLDRRQLTLDQKRRLAEYLIQKNPSKSDRQVAKEAGISPTTAGDIRRKATVQNGHDSQVKGGKPPTEPRRNSLGRKVGEKPKPIPEVSKIRAKIAELKKEKARIEKEILVLEKKLKK